MGLSFDAVGTFGFVKQRSAKFDFIELHSAATL